MTITEFLRISSRIRIDSSSGCWLYHGSLKHDGYSDIQMRRRKRSGHRLFYEALIGPVPKGLELDHLCRSRNCLNPTHLEPVTHAENMQRSAAARATHCKRGHEYSEDNLKKRADGHRQCRACINVRARYWRMVRRLEAAQASGQPPTGCLPAGSGSTSGEPASPLLPFEGPAQPMLWENAA